MVTKTQETRRHETAARTPTQVVYEGGKSTRLASFIVTDFRDLFRFRYAISNFVRNSLRARYRRSALGFLWSLLNPLITMAVTATVFSMILRFPLKNFAIFIFSGLLPWAFMSGAIRGGGQSIVIAETYLKKIYLPKSLFPAVATLTEAVNFLLSLISLFILGLLVFGLDLQWSQTALPLAFLLMLVFSLGVAEFLAVATVFFRDLSHISEVGFAILFYLVPILYPLDVIPEQYRAYFRLNPFYHFIHLFRLMIYEGRFPTLGEWLIPTGLALAALFLGTYALKRTDHKLILRL